MSKKSKRPDAIPAKELAEQAQTEDLFKKVVFKPGALIWNNFHVEQPQPDRWIVLWCAFGKLCQNLYITYRNQLGHYELPHPTKHFPAQAWAYIDNPFGEVPEESPTPAA